MDPTHGQSAPNALIQVELQDVDAVTNGGTPHDNVTRKTCVDTVTAMDIGQITVLTLIATANTMKGVSHVITLGILAAPLNLLKGKT